MTNLFVGGFPFTLVTTETRGGKIIRETYFKADGSKVKVEIDYTLTEKGYKWW